MTFAGQVLYQNVGKRTRVFNFHEKKKKCFLFKYNNKDNSPGLNNVNKTT